jgi:hypothetical protein
MPTATRTRAPRLYTYSQLGPKGKAAAREWYRTHHTWDGVDDLSELLNNDLSEVYGVTGCEVMYSLNSCQGDGVAFRGNPDLDVWAEHDEELRGLLDELNGLAALLGFDEPCLSVVIHHRGRCYHDQSMEVNVDELSWVDGPNRQILDDRIAYLNDYLSGQVSNISRKLERTGYAEIAYRDSDDYLDELLSGNDDNDYFRFDRRGNHCG